jgi:PAS domain S-box-containing protein
MNGFWTLQQVFAFTITAAAAVGIGWKFVRQLIKQSNATHTKIEAIEKLLIQVERSGMTDGAEKALGRLEQKILLTQAQVRLVMEVDGTGYVETDKDGGLIYCNTQFVKWTGLSAEEARGYGWAAAIHPDDRDRVVKDWSSAVKDQRPLDLWYRYRYNKEIISVHARSVVVRDEHREDGLLGFVAIIVPIVDSSTDTMLS